MNHLGNCNIQYARNFCRSKKLVLSADRDQGDCPIASLYDKPDTQELLIYILQDIQIEDMRSDPRAGNKERADFYFRLDMLPDLISILDPFVSSLSVSFDDTPRYTPDPTGMEHPNGIPLGEIFHQYSTNLFARCTACYGQMGFQITSRSRLFLDPENKRGKKFHLGLTMNSPVEPASERENYFLLCLKYPDLKRFLSSVKIAQTILSL